MPSAQSPVLEELVLALDLQQITLVAHDWGGAIGLDMATRQPERVVRLLITNTWAWPMSESDPGDFHRSYLSLGEH